MMKKAICAILVAALAAGALGPLAAPVRAEEEKFDNRGDEFDHNSPLFGPVVMVPVGLVSFLMDVPIFLTARKQPFTDGLTEMKLINGYNPITSTWSDEAKHRDQGGDMDVSGGGY